MQTQYMTSLIFYFLLPCSFELVWNIGIESKHSFWAKKQNTHDPFWNILDRLNQLNQKSLVRSGPFILQSNLKVENSWIKKFDPHNVDRDQPTLTMYNPILAECIFAFKISIHQSKIFFTPHYCWCGRMRQRERIRR